MDPPNDSIDGLGLTFEHLSRAGKQLALFRLAQRKNLSDEQRALIAGALRRSKETSDKNQAILTALTQE